MANNDRIFQKLFNDIGKLKKNIQDNITADTAEEAARLIKIRTRLGYGANGEQREKLKPLSAPYIKQRENIVSNVKIGKMRVKTRAFNSSVTTAKKSNLTRYGDMLNSIRSKYLGNGKSEITIVGNDSNGISNNQKAQWNEEKGRKFFSITKNEKSQLARFVRDRLDILIKSTDF